MQVVARFSGLITYSDGSVQQCAGHLDDAGNLSLNDAVQSAEAIAAALAQGTWIEDMLALLTAGVTLTPTGASSRTVTSVVAECSGRVTYADGTWGDWIVQYTPQTGAFVPEGGSVGHWTAALADSSVLSALQSLFVAIA